MELSICHLYYDKLGQFGDSGNLLCMMKRLEWRGIGVSLTRLSEASSADLTAFDIIFIGGGMGIDAALEDVRAGAGFRLREAVDAGVTILAVCEGLELLGKYRTTADGERHSCAGAADFHVVIGKDRLTGDCLYDCGDSDIVAFENHAARLYAGADVYPVGNVLRGHGRNGEDGTAGVRFVNLFGSLCHGPLLPKNPALADMVLCTALTRKYPEYELTPLDDTLELRAHRYMASRLMGRGGAQSGQ